MTLLFGITTTELLLFLLQLGLAMAGAASLWGMVLLRKGLGDSPHGDECIIYDWLAEKMLVLLYIGIATAGAAWFAVTSILPVFAHEGIVLVPTLHETSAAFELAWPIFALWLLISPLGLFVRRFSPGAFHRRLMYFFGMQFLFATALISIPAWTGDFSLRQSFFTLHGFHSIFTLGTVLVLDFLFLISKASLHLKQHIYPLFPTISKIILIGLGLEFIGVTLVFPEAIALTPKFYFAQTLIGVLLINGMVLAGPVTRRMIAAVSSSDGVLARRWELIGDVAGTVSVTSWVAITVVDFFRGLTLGYTSLIGIWAAVLVGVLTAHLLWRYVFELSIPRSYFAWHRS